MQFHTAQGVASHTFRPPPPDGSLNLVESLDYNGKHSPNHPLFLYEDGGVHAILWSTAVRAFHAAARLVSVQVKGAVATPERPPVIAILSTAGSVNYFALVVGIMRAGYLPFPISTRNSDAAVAHLLNVAGAMHLYCSSDSAMQKLANTACARLADSGITILPIPTFQDMFGATSDGFEYLPALTNVDLDAPSIMLHSSGSTAFPKPVTITNRMMLENGRLPYFGERDLCGQVIGAHSVPMFHIMGVLLITWATMTGLTIAVFPPSETLEIPAPDRVLASAVATDCTLLYCVPSFLEDESPERLAILRRFSTVIFSGGPLQEKVGDYLTEKGVTIAPLYGLTETGIISMFIPKNPPRDAWASFRISPHISPAFVRVEGEQDTFRVIVKESALHTLAVANTMVDGSNALDTNDLVIRHPTNVGFYRIYGRHDDQIMHSTGEKTNPLPIEARLLKDPRITGALVFGRSKFHAGVLVAPRVDYAFDPADSVRLAEYRNKIWATVEEANRDAPQHSRIFKEMIVVTHPFKPFEYTAKGTPRRHVILRSYANEIEDAYAAAEASALPDMVVPQQWDRDGVCNFVRAAVRIAVGTEVADNEDIFRAGGDSLAATSIRNALLRALRASGVPDMATRAVPHDVVFAFPSINALSGFLYGIILGTTACVTNGPDLAAERVGIDENTDDDPEGRAFRWPQLGQVGQSIVRVREGRGEPPLIMLPGAGGTLHAFGPFQSKFRSALWLVQVTPDTPLASLDTLADFLFDKIKELRPRGPYRICAYSATDLLAFALVQRLEDAGDEVEQLALLDHFPTLFLADGNPAAHDAFVDAGIANVHAMFLREGGLRVVQLAHELDDAIHGRPTSRFSVENWRTMRAVLSLVADFLVELARSNEAGIRGSLELWLRRVRAPLTVYVASRGIRGGLVEESDERDDLGARRCFLDTQIVQLDGGHFDILGNDNLITSLQGKYLGRTLVA